MIISNVSRPPPRSEHGPVVANPENTADLDLANETSLDRGIDFEGVTDDHGEDDLNADKHRDDKEVVRHSYFALSYTWGRPSEQFPQEWDDPLFTYSIFVNGKRYQARPNLYYALCELARSPQLIRGRMPIWIDALCIDQSNIAEKNVQVSRMGDIYSHACAVIVWLGPEDETTAAAVQTMESILRTSQKQDKIQDGRDPGKFVFSFGQTWDEMIQDHNLKSNIQRILYPIQTMRRRSWFNRAWVWQEVCLASEATFWCGSHRMSLSWFRQIYGVINSDAWYVMVNRLKADQTHQFILGGIDTLAGDFEIFERLVDLQGSTLRREAHLTSMLRFLRHNHSSDPRDKVFAVLGMCPGHERVEVDYEKTLNDVLTSVVALHIINHGNVNFLRDCRFSTAPKLSLRRRPSWVPDWSDHSFSRKTGRERSEVGSYHGVHLVYKGGSGSHAPPPRISRDCCVLQVRGRLIDKVKFIAPVHRASEDRVVDMFQRSSGYLTSVSEHSATILPAEGALWLHDWARKHPRGGCHLYSARCFYRSRGRLKQRVIFQLPWLYRHNGNAKQFERLHYGRTDQTLLDAYKDLIGSRSSRTYIDIYTANKLAAKTFATSITDLFLLVPVETRIGDEILIIMGEEYPYILRRAEQGYMVVGECQIGYNAVATFVPHIEQYGEWEDIRLV